MQPLSKFCGHAHCFDLESRYLVNVNATVLVPNEESKAGRVILSEGINLHSPCGLLYSQIHFTYAFVDLANSHAQ